MTTVEPFTIAVGHEMIDDLRARLDRTRWPQTVSDAGWDYGTDAEWLRELVDYWSHAYDWEREQAALNQLPQVMVRVGGMDVHAIHAVGRGPDPLPLVLTHGWPSTCFEMQKVIGPLSDPASHGGDPADAFHVVAPSLPGYGFSTPPAERGFAIRNVAGLWCEVMSALGYERFGSHGGDWGSAVTTALGAHHSDRMVGIHLSMLAPPIDEASLTPEQREWWGALKIYRDTEWGYVHLQRTKPQTLSFALTDSPVGLAAWILEKWWRWSDIVDEHGIRDPYRTYTRDELLTIVTIYWLTETIGPSMRLYAETFGPGSLIEQPRRIDVPTGVAVFNEINRPPRALAEPYYNITRWTEIDRGGHFPAMENPDALVHELREFFRPLRSAAASGSATESGMRKATESAVVAFNDAINARDLGSLSALMSDDHRFIDAEGNLVDGKRACVDAWRGFFAAFPDYRNVFESVERRADGVVEVSGYSVCSEPLLDGPARWRAVVRGGLVAEWRVFA